MCRDHTDAPLSFSAIGIARDLWDDGCLCIPRSRAHPHFGKMTEWDVIKQVAGMIDRGILNLQTMNAGLPFQERCMCHRNSSESVSMRPEDE